MFVKYIEDLEIYKIALQLAKEIHELTIKIPRYWQVEEVDDIQRSSSSVPSNIEEGFSHRFYSKQFLRYLYIAMGSSDETKGHLRKLYMKNYIGKNDSDYYIQQFKFLSIKILNFITYLRKKHNINIPTIAPQLPHNSPTKRSHVARERKWRSDAPQSA
jgi:four helix bundle protein